MTNVANPQNICFKNILNGIYFLQSQNKTNVYICQIQFYFFKLLWIFLTIRQISHKFSNFFGFFFYVTWFKFKFFILRKSNYDVPCSFFVIKNQITICLKEIASSLSSLLHNKYGASWLCQNQVRFFRMFFKIIFFLQSQQKSIFF